MKRIFLAIFILITLSVVGIIWIQISWVKNIMLVQEEQIKHNVQDITSRVADELGAIKGSQQPTSVRPFPLENAFEMPQNYAIAQRFTAQELYEKIRLQFIAQKMEKVPFEFGIARIGNGFWVERRSNNFNEWNSDTANYYRYVRPIVAPSASAMESLVHDELLILVIPRVDELVNVGVRPKIAIAVIFTLIILTAFFLTVSTIYRQKKLSEIKNDFINNMTHEFKTPIATISLAVDALRNEKVQSDPKKLSYFSEIIKEENQRMNRQVETILKAALLERQEIQLNRKELDAHQIIQDVADNFMLRLQEKGGTLELKLGAGNALIHADEVHFSNLVNNLMDNAVKYGKENVPPKICLSTHSDEKRFFLRIEDNGIGMNRETLKRIFERFYRAHTGNIHNVKGFGLGLSYVKSVIDAHHGQIRPESTLGKGSVFTIELPLHDKEKA
ncbi:HAMP domain-containing sensor histidine kinase [Flaviaesturariibacter amylovorans]|uniref:sensor histidine kinase n=1 Tax=Flaviaesturariibacter amylovorans TaxID=1084520 RepID=UPI0031E6D3EB